MTLFSRVYWLLFQMIPSWAWDNVEMPEVREAGLFCREATVSGLWLASLLPQVWRVWKSTESWPTCRGNWDFVYNQLTSNCHTKWKWILFEKKTQLFNTWNEILRQYSTTNFFSTRGYLIVTYPAMQLSLVPNSLDTALQQNHTEVLDSGKIVSFAKKMKWGIK